MTDAMASDNHNRIKELRIRAGLTLEELAERSGTVSQQIWKLENGRRRLTSDWMVKLAEALQCSPLEILSASMPSPNTAEIRGEVGDEDRFFPLETTPRPSLGLPFKTEGLVAALVRDSSLWPVFQKGDALLYVPSTTVDESKCLYNECVIKTQAGSVYVKRLFPGNQPGSYRLASYRHPDLDNVAIEWASPIVWIHRKLATS